MAGAFLISKGSGVSMGTLGFDYIVEETRKRLSEKDRDAMKSAFEPYDEQGMMFISLEELDGHAFNAFCHATQMARLECLENNSSFPQTLWKELSEKLAEDPRYAV